MPRAENTVTMTDTTISLPENLADELYDRKERGESYADVIQRLIERADSDPPDTQVDESGRESAVTPATDTAGPAGTSADEPPESVQDAGESLHALVNDVGGETLPGSGKKLDERVAALRAVVEYLREHGTATPTDFQTDVYPEHQARYTDADDPARSWWKNAMYPGLGAVADRTDAVEKADQTGEWTWRGESA